MKYREQGQTTERAIYAVIAEQMQACMEHMETLEDGDDENYYASIAAGVCAACTTSIAVIMLRSAGIDNKTVERQASSAISKSSQEITSIATMRYKSAQNN